MLEGAVSAPAVLAAGTVLPVAVEGTSRRGDHSAESWEPHKNCGVPAEQPGEVKRAPLTGAGTLSCPFCEADFAASKPLIAGEANLVRAPNGLDADHCTKRQGALA